MRRQAISIATQRVASTSNSQGQTSNTNDAARRQDIDHAMQDVSTDGLVDGVKPEDSAGGPSQSSPQSGARAADVQRYAESQLPAHLKQSWDYIEEVVQILKTAFPLLILSLETMIDQIAQRFKATPEEEVYRLVCMLLQDAIQVRPAHYTAAIRLLTRHFKQYIVRMYSDDNGQLAPHTVTNLSRLAISLTGAARVCFDSFSILV